MIPQRYVYAAMLSGIMVMASLLWMPAMLGVLAQGYGLETGALSRLAAAELTGFLLGTLYASNQSTLRLVRWAAGGCVVVIAANSWNFGFDSGAPSAAVRLIAGLGAGLGFGYGLKVCAGSAQPTRNFGIFAGCMSITMIVGFQLIAKMLEFRPNVSDVAKTVFAIYGIAAAGSALSLSAFRLPAGPAHAESSERLRLPAPRILIGLAAIGLTYIGQGAVWAFLQILGVSHGFAVADVANAMSAFALAGVAGSFTAAMIPREIPRWIAISGASLLLAAGLFALYAPRTVMWYVAGCVIGGFYWNFVLPLILGLLAWIDRSGQGSVLGGTMSSVGSAIGPLLAAQLIIGANYRPVGWMAAIMCLAGLICVWWVESGGTPVLAESDRCATIPTAGKETV